jgi:hypothetical protein
MPFVIAYVFTVVLCMISRSVFLFILNKESFKDIKKDYLDEETKSILDDFTITFFPFINLLFTLFIIVGIISILVDHSKAVGKEKPVKFKEKKRNKKLFKKNPELSSISTLEKIQFEYKIQLLNLDVSKASNLWILNFNQNLLILIEDLKKNHTKPKITQLLLTYEVTFARILSILNESNEIEKELYDELLFVSKDSINYFIEEVQNVNKLENELFNESKETTRKRFIEELKSDLDFQKNRNNSL